MSDDPHELSGRVRSEPLVDRLEAERARLESVLLRLPEILREVETGLLLQRMATVAVDAAHAELGLWAPADDPAHGILVGLDGGSFEDLPDPWQAPLLAAVITGSGALRIDDTTRWAGSEEASRPYGSLVGGELVRSWMGSPVVASSGAVLGALFVAHRQARAFTGRDEAVLTAIAAYLAVALEKADLLAERAHVAQALQQSLLPPLLPDIDGVDSAVRYRPTGAGNLVGGDFYDLFPSGPGTWDALLGDVSGFGPGAAALTGVARHTIRAVATTQAPVDALRSLNDAILGQRSGERFCTAVLVRLRPDAEGIRLEVAQGGHPPPLLLRDGGTVEVLDADTGTLLGLFPDAPVGLAEVVLAPGDAIVLCTDGVFEARDPAGLQLGEERVGDLLRRCAGRTADGIARRLELAVIDHQAGVTMDDVAILVLRAPPDEP